jgi:IS4 transposase
MDGRLTTEILTSALPDSLIEKVADAYDLVQRERKVDIVVLVWTLILGFPAGAKRTLTSLKRRFEQVANIEISRSAFYDRLTPALASVLRQLVDWMLDVRIEQTAREIDDQFEGFKELLAVDSTVLNLHDLLAPSWEATNEGQAAAKMHVIANATTGGPNSVKLTDQRTHDSQPLKTVGQWVDGCLLMGDLAYYDFHLFHRIDQQGGYFISKVKDGANPRIVATNQTVPGRSIDLEGKQFQEVIDRLERQTLDVVVALDVKLRKYRGRSRTVTRLFRLVGRKDPESGEYHLYFTNVSPETLTPEDVAEAYGLRWQVELLFSRLKSTLRLHELPSSKDHIVRGLIWASILALLCSHVLLDAMRRRRPDRVFPAQRMSAVFRDYADFILWTLVAHRRDGNPNLFEMMERAAADPNRHRSRSHDALESIPLANERESGLFSDACA